MKSGLLTGGAAAVGADLLAKGSSAHAQKGGIRPLRDKFAGAVATIASFTADGLFTGQNPEFLKVLQIMAIEADAAVRLG